MIRFLVPVVVTIALCLAACSSTSPAANNTEAPKTASVTGPADFVETEPLPVLRVRLLEPKHKTGWELDSRRWQFQSPQDATGAGAAGGGEPYASDAEAVAAAKAWLAEQFGPLPRGVTLRVGDIDHSATGHDAPRNDTGRGHTIVLFENYRGVATSESVVVYIRGRTIEDVSSGLTGFEEVPETARAVVPRTDAIRTFRQVAERFGPEAVAAFDREANLSLFYTFSQYQAGEDDPAHYVGPNWVFELDHPEILVDGYSGKPWRND